MICDEPRKGKKTIYLSEPIHFKNHELMYKKNYFQLQETGPKKSWLRRRFVIRKSSLVSVMWLESHQFENNLLSLTNLDQKGGKNFSQLCKPGI